MKTFAVTVDKTVYCVTTVVLEQLIAPQLCREATASNKNSAILHQKSKFLNTVVCCLVVRRCPEQNKEFRVT